MDINQFLTVFTYKEKKYYLRYNSDYSMLFFYIKENNAFIYVGDEENERLNKKITINKKRLYKIRNIRLNTKAMAIILGLNITITSLVGCTVNKGEIEKFNNRSNIYYEQINELADIPVEDNSNGLIRQSQNVIIDLPNKTLETITDNIALAEDEIEIIEDSVSSAPENNNVDLCRVNIYKYNMAEYQNIINQNVDLFNKICETVEKNDNLPGNLKMEIVSTFPRLMMAKKYIDFDMYFYRLSILEYEEQLYNAENKLYSEVSNVALASFGLNENKDGLLIPKIIVHIKGEKANSDLHHEVEHFNGSIERTTTKGDSICFINGRFKAYTSDILSINMDNTKEMTITEFQEEHEVLKKYSVQQIGQVLNKLGINQSIVNGRRVRKLPTFKQISFGLPIQQ